MFGPTVVILSVAAAHPEQPQTDLRLQNFACEQATWYILYLFTIVPFIASPIHRSTLSLTAVINAVSSITSFADVLAVGRALQGTLWNYSIWGPLTMSMLFYGSTDITEEISAGKYPSVYSPRVLLAVTEN